MARNSPMKALLLGLGLLQPAMASYWTVTSYFVPTTTYETYPVGCTESCRTYTSRATLAVVPSVTPTATPYSRRTSTQTYYDLEVVSLFIEAGSVAETDLYDTASVTSTGASVEYVVPVTYVAPSSCPTPFTVVTQTRVYLPSEVTGYLKPTSTAASTYTRRYYTSEEVTYVTRFLNPSDLPSTYQPNPTSGFDYSYYIADCVNPAPTGKSSSGSGSSSSSSSKYKVCSSYSYYSYSCTDFKLWVIIVAAVVPSLFVLGFIESFFWFRRLMCGKQALRLGTVCWCMISLWFVCFTRSQHARTQQEQKELTEKWKALKFGQKLKLWFKWGFRHKYPVELLGEYSNAKVVQIVTVVVDQDGRPVNNGQGEPPAYPAQGAYAPTPANAGEGEKGGVVVSDSVLAPPPAAHVVGQQPDVATTNTATTTTTTQGANGQGQVPK